MCNGNVRWENGNGMGQWEKLGEGYLGTLCTITATVLKFKTIQKLKVDWNKTLL